MEPSGSKGKAVIHEDVEDGKEVINEDAYVMEPSGSEGKAVIHEDVEDGKAVLDEDAYVMEPSGSEVILCSTWRTGGRSGPLAPNPR